MKIKYRAMVGSSIESRTDGEEEGSSLSGCIASVELIVNDLQSMEVKEIVRVLDSDGNFWVLNTDDAQLKGKEKVLDLDWLLPKPEKISSLQVQLKTPYSCDILVVFKDNNSMWVRNVHLGSVRAKQQIRFCELEGALVLDTKTGTTFTVEDVVLVIDNNESFSCRVFGQDSSGKRVNTTLNGVVIREAGKDCMVAVPDLVDNHQLGVASLSDGSVVVNYNVVNSEELDCVHSHFSEIGDLVQDFRIPMEKE